MTDEELAKLFDKVLTTHLFRKLRDIVQDDIDHLKAVFDVVPRKMRIAELLIAQEKAEQYIEVNHFIIDKIKDNNPYKSFQAMEIEQEISMKQDFNGYDDIYQHYLDYLLPSSVGEDYFLIVRHELVQFLSMIRSTCILTSDFLSDKKIDYSDVSELLNVARVSILKFEAVTDATADYGKTTLQMTRPYLNLYFVT